MLDPGRSNRLSRASTASRTVSDTIQLYPQDIQDREELEIERTDFSLKVIKKTYRGRSPDTNTETERLDLRSNAVLLRYAVSDGTDVASLWEVAVVLGKAHHDEIIQYLLKSEKDAFRFQRLVTGYSPDTRFRRVTGSALAQHLNPLQRATEIDIFGEIQLWNPSDPGARGELSPPLRPTATGLSVETLATSSLSTASMSHVETIQFDPDGRASVVKIATPPLLVWFAKTGHGMETEYQMMRVNIIDLECKVSEGNPKVAKLVHHIKDKRFSIDVLGVEEEESWNLCLLRPGVSSDRWQRYRSNKLALVFNGDNDAVFFRASFLRLVALARRLPVSPAGTTQTTIASSSSSTLNRPPEDNESFGTPTIEQDADDNGALTESVGRAQIMGSRQDDVESIPPPYPAEERRPSPTSTEQFSTTARQGQPQSPLGWRRRQGDETGFVMPSRRPGSSMPDQAELRPSPAPRPTEDAGSVRSGRQSLKDWLTRKLI